MENLLTILEIQKSLKRLEISKDWPRWERKAERNLTHKLRELFKITFERTVLKLQEMITVPSSDMQRKQLLFEIDNLRKEFREIISESVVESVNVGRQRTLSLIDSPIVKKNVFFENLIMKQAVIEVPFSEYSKQFEKLIREGIFIASEATMDRMIGDIMKNLADSYVKGLGVGEAAQRLKKVFSSIEDYRLERIARTEIISYQNVGSHHTCVELGVQYEQWWSARDLNVRDSHVYLHGQIVKTGDKFSNGLMFPGDKNGPIEEWIQCRCRPVPFLMPWGYMAPIGLSYFYETDLVESGLVEPEFVPAMTMTEAEDWAIEKFELERIDYTEANLDVVNEMHKQLLELEKKYPTGTEGLTDIFIGESRKGRPSVMWRDEIIWKDTRLEVNSRLVTDEISFAQQVYGKTGLLFARIDEGNEQKYMITHEYGHLLYTTLVDPKIAKQLPKGYYEMQNALWDVKIKYTDELIDLNEKLERGKITSSQFGREFDKIFISDYAKFDANEFLAESFAQVELCSTPSPYAIEIIETLRKFLRGIL